MEPNLLLLIESTDDDGKKLKHLPHAEDHVIERGEQGFHHSLHVLDSVHDSLLGKKTKTKITTKYDGAPSLVFGHHPETGKFFVASKSAFNKTPKINHTHEDITKNHPDAPGLREKLHHALNHLPKVAPKKGVYQGDFMYSKHEVDHDNKAFHFKPNTITYSTHKDSDEGKKIEKAHMGIVVHTHYKGKTFHDMRAHFDPNHKAFKNHPDVHLIRPDIEAHKAHYPVAAQHGYLKHMRMAVKTHDSIPSHGHAAIGRAKEHVNTYINAEVREGKKPTVNGLVAHIKSKAAKNVEAVKTDKAKEQRKQEAAAHVNNVTSNKEHFAKLFKVHGHVQDAKNHLVHALSTHQTFSHSINGKATKPEGFVATHKGMPTKLVDRHEFSRANFAGSMAKAKTKK